MSGGRLRRMSTAVGNVLRSLSPNKKRQGVTPPRTPRASATETTGLGVYEMVRQPISAVTMIQQMQDMCDFSAVGMSFLKEDSRLICHGLLDKVTKGGLVTLYWWLLNDTLLFGFLSNVNSTCHIMRAIPLARCFVRSGADSIPRRVNSSHVFTLTTPSDKIVMISESMESKEVWIRDMMQCILSCNGGGEEE